MACQPIYRARAELEKKGEASDASGCSNFIGSTLFLVPINTGI